MKNELEHKVLVAMKRELDAGVEISGNFDEGIQRKIRRNGQRRKALTGIGVLLMVFGTATVVLYEVDSSPAREPSSISHDVDIVQVDDERLAEEWWEEEWAVTDDDEAYTEEFQALALLVTDPMYRDVKQLKKGE